MRYVLIALLVSAMPAFAEDQAHLNAFDEGRYEDAAAIAEKQPTPDALAFAARSLLAEAMSNSDYEPPLSLLNAAETKARDALAIAPEHIEARLQLAIALSLKARPLSNREGMRTGYGKDAKSLADGVLEDDPENSYVHGFLAVWHLEVRRRGGSIGASVMGASVRKGREHYQRAIAIEPGDASLHWQYARALAALNSKKYKNEILEALNHAIECETDSTLENVMKERARILLTALETKSRKNAERVAAQML